MGCSSRPAVSAPSPQQPSPWQQPDLLTLIPPPAPAPVSDPAAVTAPAAAPAPVPAAASAPAAPRRGPASLLILDTETTGLDPARGRCIEVGAILFTVAERAVLSQVSFLLPTDTNPAEHVNGIAAAVTRLPQPWQAGLRCFMAMLEAADAVLAHNAAFDRQWFGIDPLPPVGKPWICSMEDIRWPAHLHLRASPSVRDLALAHGVPVWAAHRALSDCTYLAQVLERCADLEALLLGALEPRQLFRARLSYAERQKARDAGFRWNDPVPGSWSRRLTEAEAAALPFPVERVDPEAAGHLQTRPALGQAAA
ncbi:3'-5' exonuclease [Cyanobium sp. CH-040]|uniref:3'-5' exonuclease n=1 Tax=Cyanobium sp. CH-040 TaxID=2823708 RepID=UPI0020CBAC64|nr:3'-5' exonuclease [Cyanobium sp. CH-040]MCP9926845.1 3'-5' exonuclease [Cyanobium sp. CH-040]